MTVDANARFFFMHIMKTAGTSFANALRAQFPNGTVHPAPGATKSLDYWTFDHLLALEPQELAEVRLIHGHYPLFVGELTGFDRTVTILRDPIDRLISHLRQLVRNGFENWTSVEDAYDSVFGDHMRNYQLRQFSRSFDDDPLELDDAHLRRGIERLDLIELLGFTDRYGDFIDQCRQRFGWDISSGPRLQVGTDDLVIDPGFRRRLEQDNELDIEFYRLARQKRS